MRGILVLSLILLVPWVSSGQQTQATLPRFFEVDRATLPAALQNVPLERLSSGALMLLDRSGNLVHPPVWAGRAPALAAPQVGVALDPRVGGNLHLGDDPAALPANMRSQAEPHIARSTINPDFLAATFQEGRFTNGGSVDCGYSISSDGGLTWSRALIPNLTQTTGGPYYRDTDPVAAIDLNGYVYLNTEAATDPNFNNGIILVSRSTDGGTTFGSPVVVYQPPANGSIFPDKNWMAINTFAGTSTVGRMVVTFTSFASASPITRAYSDDGGATWSAVAFVHPSNTSAQGSQPVFLSNGKFVIVYFNFGNSSLQLVNSNDGGVTFGSPKPVAASVSPYDEPAIRTGGSALSSVVADRTTTNLYVVYQALLSGNPKIAFVKSTDGGTTWSAPVAISDNPATSGVFNAAIAVSPNGQTLTAVFYDHRNNPGSNTLVDLYLAQSFDGGMTWQPNIRVTPVSTDAALAPLTSSGYMLGDYQGIAESTNVNVPAVPVWVDARTGNPDPFIARIGIASQLNFASWQAARLSLGRINNPQLGGVNGDADGDGKKNLLEYVLGTPPLMADTVGASLEQIGSTFSITFPRLKAATDASLHAFRSINLAPNSWTNSGVTETLVSDDGTIQTWRASTPANGASPLFFRLQATQP